MLDIKRIREDPEGVRAALARRDPALGELLDEVIARDEQWRAATASAEAMRAQQREQSGQLAQASKRGEDVQERQEQMKQMSAQVKELTERARVAQEERQQALAALPNTPHPSAAEGPEDEVVREVGELPKLGFEPRDHLQLAGAMIDTERAANVSGSRFAYLKGELRALYGTGFLPDTEQQIYSLSEDDLYLIGTSEVALASLHDDEIVPAELLPLRYAGFSPCFRREAGAAGKDTRGIFRVHQFDKVEMFSFVAPEDSSAEHERILAIEEEILQELGLPYRVVNIAVGELGSSAAKKYDCEAWIPSQGRYRELTSCSDTTDYQARRLNIRMRSERGTRAVHTLNGTAVAVGRTLIALLENGQQQDGAVQLPQALVPYGAPAELQPAAAGSSK